MHCGLGQTDGRQYGRIAVSLNALLPRGLNKIDQHKVYLPVVVAYRADNFIVGLTNVSPLVLRPTLRQYTLCGQYPGAVPRGATVSVYCQDNLPPAIYVIIQLPKTDYMNFCELEVFVRGTQSCLQINVDLFATVHSSVCFTDHERHCRHP